MGYSRLQLIGKTLLPTNALEARRSQAAPPIKARAGAGAAWATVVSMAMMASILAALLAPRTHGLWAMAPTSVESGLSSLEP